MASHITITPIAGPVTVTAGATPLGQSRNALELKEGSYPPVVYVPRADIDMGRLSRTDRATTCPWKGQASYYSVETPGGRLDNAVWSYESPLADMALIAGHLAFYPDKVTVTRG
ncbi:MAG: DUF427 domain-containing protein [Tabrizicola sp.]|jgi:uncharacterized protein (DUF427 family)|nr:DUF427 domain-containing protein [Tabrizicola sp.]